MEINGSTIIITGAARRFGKTLALALAAKGAAIGLHCHSHVEEGRQTVAQIERQGGQALLLPADLLDISQLVGMFEKAVDHFGHVDAVVNCASVFRPVSLEETDSSEWDSMHDLHVRAPFLLAKELYLHRQKMLTLDGPGCVVNITDSSVRHPSPRRVAYACAKIALERQTAVLAATLAPLVRVNAVAPGLFLAASTDDGSYGERLIKRLPLKKLTEEHDVVAAVEFVLATESLTGVIIPVDCGEHLT